MCGILGEYSPSNNLSPIDRFKKLLDISKSRGQNESSIKSISNKGKFLSNFNFSDTGLVIKIL